MNYSAINIQGNIISSEILEKIRTEDIRFQKPSDFNLPPNTNVRDEINLAWSLAVSNWNVFKAKRDALKDSDSGTTETRKYWMLPLLGILGYEITTANAEIINDKSYAISHRATNKDGFPIHIIGINQSMDKRPETGGTRLSPHALAQEYTNNVEHLYALVSNGSHLRLVRDATRLSRLSYLEFNLEQIMDEGLYVEFALLYRALHASRMPVSIDQGADSILEFYHQEAIASGTRIRERLSIAVEQSIRELANGFLHHPQNEHVRQQIESNKLDAKQYYFYTLRLVYRILFLLVIEERKLIYAEKLAEATTKKRSIYYDFYSLQRLTKLATKLVYVDPKKTDLWQSLLSTFALFEHGKYGSVLGIAPLGAGLFAPDALGIISHQVLDNECLLKVLRYLVSFENENKQQVRVNYADLDVEEFGSVYEGLLEYDPLFTDSIGQPVFSFVKGDARSSSGSHYTPEELVKPLIKHSLDYLIEDKLKAQDKEAGLLSLKVCDVACGSGHILLSAARRIGWELACLREAKATGQSEKVDQPTPPILRTAVRDVIKNCIYGVDKNPLAVELCKVALWLEAHAPGEPLNFLDHHIKCGDAIVGLAHRSELENGIADEAFKTLPADNKEIAAAFRKRNQQERKQQEQAALDFDVTINNEVNAVIEKFNLFKKLPETTPDEIAKKEKEYRKFEQSVERTRLKQLADAQVAQFFIPKTDATKAVLLTDAEYRGLLKNVSKGMGPLQSQKLAYAETLLAEHRFFHWFIEFPEVFNDGGFDCILGNPPFLGNRKLSGTYGDPFLESIKYQFAPIGAVDLVTYFFRRIFTIIKQGGFQSLISTNTIAQGNAREDGLEIIVQNGGTINHAVKSMKWPGQAAVEVSLVTITKQKWNKALFLSGSQVKIITPYLDNAETLGNPFTLKQNEDKSFQGSIVLGKGFVMEPKEAKSLIEKNKQNKEVLFPYLNGEDLNNSPDQAPSRWVINFFDWSEEKAKQYSDCYAIVEKHVKPERQRWAIDNDKKEIIGEYALRKPLPEKWWIYADKRPALYKTISPLKKVIVVAQVSKTLGFTFVPSDQVLSMMCIVLAFDNSKYLSLLQSNIHKEWVQKYASALKSDIRYTPSDVFETFPFPQNINQQQEQQLETIGEAYHEHRRQLMLGMQLGLTKTYNLFHSNAITAQSINEKDKQVASLQKHLEKTANTISFDEAIKGILKLRELHVQMDEAVLDAYGWGDLSPALSKGEGAIKLRHDFYEVDYLPENDRVRFTIHPDARKEVLKRLLELNHKIHEEEVKAGLWDKKKSSGKKILKEAATANGVDLFNQED